jgi:hypothetical protein
MNSTPERLAADHLDPAAIPLPRLSDDAVIQIHDFIHHVLDVFEARYGDQIHRFYQDLSSSDDDFLEPSANLDLFDPPF